MAPLTVHEKNGLVAGGLLAAVSAALAVGGGGWRLLFPVASGLGVIVNVLWAARIRERRTPPPSEQNEL